MKLSSLGDISFFFTIDLFAIIRSSLELIWISLIPNRKLNSYAKRKKINVLATQ
jgi:hypothetical protein